MAKVLIENGSGVSEKDIDFARRGSWQMSIRKIVLKGDGNPTPETHPDQPRSKAFGAATELGHNELVILVSRKRDQGDIPSLYEPIWPTLKKAMRFCEAKIAIIRLLLDEAEKTENVRDTKKLRYYSPCFCSLFSKYETYQCCDISLRLFWEKEKKFTSYKSSIDRDAVYTAASTSNNLLLKVLFEMNVNIIYIDH